MMTHDEIMGCIATEAVESMQPFKVFTTPDSGEMSAVEGHPRCPDCNGDLQQCGIDLYLCRKCHEGWTMTPIP
jgi:tRNA(Ile2) C34 agmatinyltransferase TiaS